MTRRTIGRRRFVTSTAALSSAMVAAPFVRGAYAAGKLAIGLWDHWVPGANAGAEAVAKAWAEKEKVDLQIDFITSQGNKLILTAAAEAQARSGHDILHIGAWDCARYSDQLVPVDDVMGPLVKQNGAASAITTYLGKIDGKWLGVPATPGAQFKGPTSRIDLLKQHAGIDVQAMYPQGRQLDARHLPQGGGGLSQGGLPVRHRARHDR
jgi:ABC-type glycerol-3-phosphate transport system substrate-binding protein